MVVLLLLPLLLVMVVVMLFLLCHHAQTGRERGMMICVAALCFCFAVLLRSQAALLRERCATHVKERRAVLTIMEQKIKKLVANAGQEARNILLPSSDSSAGDGAPVSLLETTAGQRLSRELKTLSRLVNASIAALKNSAR